LKIRNKWQLPCWYISDHPKIADGFMIIAVCLRFSKAPWVISIPLYWSSYHRLDIILFGYPVPLLGPLHICFKWPPWYLDGLTSVSNSYWVIKAKRMLLAFLSTAGFQMYFWSNIYWTISASPYRHWRGSWLWTMLLLLYFGNENKI